MKGVAWNNVNDSRFKILHELDLPFTVARACGDDKRTDFLCTVMKTESSGEETVGHHVLKNIAFSHACHVHAASHKVRPFTDIPGGVKDDRGSSRRAGRRVQSYKVFFGDRRKAVWPLIAKIILCCRWNILYVLYGTEKIRIHGRFFETFPVK